MTDASMLGSRVRHFRSVRGLTLRQLGDAVGLSASRLSLLETGRREPKVSDLAAIATALGVAVAELLADEAPSSRAALELELQRIQSSPRFAALGIEPVRPNRGLSDEALGTIVGLHRELLRRETDAVATPEAARLANTELRGRMREVDNHLPEIEAIAEEVVAETGHTGGALTHREVNVMAAKLGFSLVYVDDLPASARSVTDLENKRIYLPPASIPGGHGLRSMALQAMAHRILGHDAPADYADFLRQRLEINYFAACCLMPERDSVEFLRSARDSRDLAVEDFRDAFGVTHEAAALRMTNLLTRHLDIRLHFLRLGDDGALYKGYENDGLPLPADVTGAIEGQLVCKRWGARQARRRQNRTTEHYQYTDTPAGSYWCSTQTGSSPEGGFSITVGVPFDDAKWWRGRETGHKAVSSCPDPACCRQPAPDLRSRWESSAWPSARLHAQILSPLPRGRFPGVETTEVYEFLERHAGA